MDAAPAGGVGVSVSLQDGGPFRGLGTSFGKRDNSQSTSNFSGLMGELQQSRINLENDHRAYKQYCQELEVLQGRKKELLEKRAKIDEKIHEDEMTYATLASDLSHFVIREKVLTESLEGLEKDLESAWDKLGNVRLNYSAVSSRYLRETTKFALLYNLTDIGKERRKAESSVEFQNLTMKKQQLECSLAKLITMKQQTEESQQEIAELQRQFSAQDDSDSRREKEALNQMRGVENTLQDLEQKKNALESKLQTQISSLQTAIQSVNESVSYWERRVSENQRMMAGQQGQVGMQNSATSPGFPPSANSSSSFALPNGHVVPTNNKNARLSQFVRPVQQQVPIKPQVTHENAPPKRIQTKIQQFATTLGKPSIAKPSKPKFVPPTTKSSANTSSSSMNTSSSGNSQQYNTQRNNNFHSPGTFSSSQYFTSPIYNSKSICEPKLPSSQFNTASSSNTSGSSSSAGRTFQFKKKSFEGPNIPGPKPGQTVGVTLGSTPFSTFQKSCNVLQDQQQNTNTSSTTEFDGDEFGDMDFMDSGF